MGWYSEISRDVSKITDAVAYFESELQAEAAAEYLRSEKVIVRKVKDYGLPQSLRISIGKESDCARLREKMHSFMGKQNAL